MCCSLPKFLARLVLPLALAALALPLAAAGDVTDYQLTKLAIEGDADPVSGTIIFLESEVSITAGRVAFSGHNGGDTRIYVADHGFLTVEVADGDVAPGTGGSLLTDVGRARVARPDALAWSGAFAGGRGGFLREGASALSMLLPGDLLAGGGTVESVPRIHSAALGPYVAFGADVDAGGPGTIAVHLVHGPGGLREVYREGSAAPAGIGGVFSPVETFHEAAAAADGSVVFGAPVSGGSVGSGLFHSSAGGTLTTLLAEGDTVTTPGGGTFAFFALWAAVNAAGDVAFNANVLRAPAAFAREAIFVLESGGTQREILIQGDTVSGAPPAAPLFGGLLGSSPPEVSDDGVVVFTALLEDAGLTTSVPAVVADDGGGPTVLVKAGDPVPDVPGAVFSDFVEARIDAQGRIAIEAGTSAGSGVFLATLPAKIPALPWWGFAAGALLLAAAAGIVLRARAGREG